MIFWALSAFFVLNKCFDKVTTNVCKWDLKLHGVVYPYGNLPAHSNEFFRRGHFAKVDS